MLLGVVLGAGQRGMLGQGHSPGRAGREGEQQLGTGVVKSERDESASAGQGLSRLSCLTQDFSMRAGRALPNKSKGSCPSLGALA